MKKLLLLLFLTTQAYSWSTPEPRGYWVTSSDAKTLYGHTEFHGNYKIAQWSIPEDLPGFVEDVTENSHMRVEWDKETKTTSLTLRGNDLPCGDELDGFISPLSMVYSGPVNSYKEITLKLDIYREEYFINNLSCPVTQGGDLVGIVFFNEVSKQILFYQLRFSNVRMNPNMKYWWRNALIQSDGWVSWGYRDQLFTYKASTPEVGEWESYDLNVKRVVKRLIKNKSDMDNRLGNWKIRTMYYGSHIWGDMDMSTKWKNVKITTK